MERCLELASKGLGSVAPNPMVGCVIVYKDRIVGEGYHRAFGEAHAEVNAISSVQEPGILARATLYVNLEPCSHVGKTPSCASLILDRKIARVVIGTEDPNPLVDGEGIKMLRERGLKVRTGVLREDCLETNKRFFTFHRKKRPWILLKWARTRDGFIDKQRRDKDPERINWITGSEARQWVHKWRSEEQAVLVGTRTALLDDPALTVRLWKGRNPLRLVIDRESILPGQLKLFDGTTETLVFTSRPEKIHKKIRKNAECIALPGGTDYIPAILEHLHSRDIQSLIVEGGTTLLDSFIRSGLWDEARVFTGNRYFRKGVPSPVLDLEPVRQISIGSDLLEYYSNP